LVWCGAEPVLSCDSQDLTLHMMLSDGVANCQANPLGEGF